jgi:hypothetical protein
MFSKPPKPPTILAPIVIPQADPDALAKAQRKAMVNQNSSSSRSSTVLAPSDKLGAG